MRLRTFCDLVREDLDDRTIPYPKILMLLNANLHFLWSKVFKTNKHLLLRREEISVNARDEYVEVQGSTRELFIGKIEKVFWQTGTGLKRKLEFTEYVEPATGTNNYGTPQYYWLDAHNLNFYPYPSSSGTVIIWYYKQFPPLLENYSVTDVNDILEQNLFYVEDELEDLPDMTTTPDIILPRAYIRLLELKVAMDLARDVNYLNILREKMAYEEQSIRAMASQNHRQKKLRSAIENLWGRIIE